MNIVFITHSYMSRHLVVGSHHLARYLASDGHRVLHLSAPVTLFHFLTEKDSRYRDRVRLWRLGGRQVQPNLWEEVPFSVVPWQLARYLTPLGVHLFAKFLPSLGAILRKRGFARPDVLVIDEPRLAGVEKIIDPKVMIYRSTDLYAEMERDMTVNVAEKILLEKADAVVGTSQPVLNRLRAGREGKPFLLLENGADISHFSRTQARPEEYEHIPHPIALYAGAIDERFDFSMIETLLEGESRLSVVLIGPCLVEIPLAISSHKRIHVLGPRPYENLPAYFQHASIGLLPLNRHPANEGRSPMKLYEYAAAGLSVLARATEELRRRNQGFVHLYDDNDSLRKTVNLDRLMSPEMREAARMAASVHDWSFKGREFLSFVEQVRSRGGF